MKKLAIYPGSFDPLTLGHVDVIQRAAQLFDHLIVAVGINSSKSLLLSVEDRMTIIEQTVADLKNVEVGSFNGLLMDFANAKGAKAIVRGLRATADFEYEFQIATVNRKLSNGLDTVFLMTKWEHSFISSSVVKELAKLGGDFRSLVPQQAIIPIENALQTRHE